MQVSVFHSRFNGLLLPLTSSFTVPRRTGRALMTAAVPAAVARFAATLRRAAARTSESHSFCSVECLGACCSIFCVDATFSRKARSRSCFLAPSHSFSAVFATNPALTRPPPIYTSRGSSCRFSHGDGGRDSYRRSPPRDYGRHDSYRGDSYRDSYRDRSPPRRDSYRDRSPPRRSRSRDRY
jgi:hypothetical protein